MISNDIIRFATIIELYILWIKTQNKIKNKIKYH